MRRRDDARAGFTLLEALAALVVTAAVVAVVLPFATRLAARWWTGERAVEEADGWMQAVARMSDDLAQAVPFGLDARDGKPAAAFRAGPDSIRFLRPALGRPADIEIVTYAIRASRGGRALVRRSERFDPARFDDDTVRGAASTLLDGPFGLRLVAIARDGTRRRSWAVGDGMPAAIELSAVAGTARPVPAAPVLMPVVAQEPAWRAR